MTANPGDAPDQRDDPTAQRRRPIPADTLSVRLAIARMHAGHLTIKEAAAQCGLNYGSWSNWENGSKPRDLLDVVGRISEGLDVDHDWLLFGGPLAGPRGMPVEAKRRSPDGPGPLPRTYRPLAERTTPAGPDHRPAGRPTHPGHRPGVPPKPEQRRPVRISRRNAA